MSANVTFRDFIPQGDRMNPIRASRRATAMAWAHSRRFNDRLLENPFYGIWGDLFASLIEDESRLMVVPHLMLYRRHGQSKSVSAEVCMRTESAKRGKDDEAIADFGFLSMVWALRSNGIPQPGGSPSSIQWHQLHIQRPFPTTPHCRKLAGNPNPKKSLIHAFMDPALNEQMTRARDSIEGQTSLSFASETYTRHDELVLIAVSGEWYQWKIACRHHYALPPILPKGYFDNFYKLRSAPINPGNTNTQETKDEGEATDEGIVDREDITDEQENNQAEAGQVGEDLPGDSSVFCQGEDIDNEGSDGNAVNDDDEDEDGDISDNDDGSDNNNTAGACPIERFVEITGEDFEVEVDDITDTWPPRTVYGWSGYISRSPSLKSDDAALERANHAFGPDGHVLEHIGGAPTRESEQSGRPSLSGNGFPSPTGSATTSKRGRSPESDVGDDAPNPRQRIDPGQFPWVILEELDPLPLSLELRKTQTMLEDFARDPKFAKSSLLNSTRLPQFPDGEWTNMLAGRVVNLDHVYSAVYSVTADDRHQEKVGSLEIRGSIFSTGS